jgi:hypothetical protein
VSDNPFIPPPLPPLMSPARAREIARFLQGSALQLAELGAIGEARQAERQSQWWLAYSLVLDRTGTDGAE